MYEKTEPYILGVSTRNVGVVGCMKTSSLILKENREPVSACTSVSKTKFYSSIRNEYAFLDNYIILVKFVILKVMD